MGLKKWQGHWMQGSHKGEMTLETLEVTQQEISG